MAISCVAAARRTGLICALAGVWLAGAIQLPAATLSVTNTDNAGPGSLRQAVLDANAAAGDDTIVVAPFLNGREIILSSTIVVEAAGRVSIDASALTQGLALPDPREPGTLAELTSGSHALIVRGEEETTGHCLVEVYDRNPAATGRLVNLSTRGQVGTGASAMIAGLVVGNGQPRRFLFRAIGPSLSAFGVSNVLENPTIEVFAGPAVLAANDDWRATQSAEISATGFAPADARESAVILQLGAGSYTAIVRGRDGTSGTALVEIYELP